MAEIKQDGVYTIKGQGKDVRIQYRKGHVVPDDVEYVRVGDLDLPTEAKAEAAPANKANPAPTNKAG